MCVHELTTKLWRQQTVTWEPKQPAADETSLEQQEGSIIALGEYVRTGCAPPRAWVQTLALSWGAPAPRGPAWPESERPCDSLFPRRLRFVPNSSFSKSLSLPLFSF